MADDQDKLVDKAEKAAGKAAEDATKPKPTKDGKLAWLAKLFKKAADVSAYEMIDGYVSRPEGRDDDAIRAEAGSLSGNLPDALKGNLVDRLVEGAKARHEKATKQRAQGREDLAARTEAQARSLEVAADEINGRLPKAIQRKVEIAPRPGDAAPPKAEEEPDHPADPRRRIRGRPAWLLPLGALSLAGLLAIGFIVVSGDDDSTSGSSSGVGLALTDATSGRLPPETTDVSFADQGATYWEGDLIAAPHYEVRNGTLLIRINGASVDPVERNAAEPVDVSSSENPCEIPDTPPPCEAWDFPYQNVTEMRASFDSGGAGTVTEASEASGAYEFEIPDGTVRLTGFELDFSNRRIDWLRDENGFLDPVSEGVTLTWSEQDLAFSVHATEPAT